MSRTFVKEEKIPVGNMAKLRPWANGNVLHHNALYSVQSTSQAMRTSVLKFKTDMSLSSKSRGSTAAKATCARRETMCRPRSRHLILSEGALVVCNETLSSVTNHHEPSIGRCFDYHPRNCWRTRREVWRWPLKRLPKTLRERPALRISIRDLERRNTLSFPIRKLSVITTISYHNIHLTT